MDKRLVQLSECIEKGKINAESPHPKELLGKPGAVELVNSLLDSNISPEVILNFGLLTGMKTIGEKFKDGFIFIPDVLIAAKAMNVSMDLLKPFFIKGELHFKGKIILATVVGDLHNIGKNLVKMVLEGAGWEVIDLGVDVSSEKIITKMNESSARIIGLSALLTTTMLNMEKIIQDIRSEFTDALIIIGGAPVNSKFALEIGADYYSPDPQGMVDYLQHNFKK